MTQRRQQENMLTRLAQAEFSPTWSIGAAAITLVVALVLIIIGTTAGLSLIGQNATGTLVGWVIGCGLIAFMVWQTRARDREGLKLGAPTLPMPLILFIGLGAAIGLDLLGLIVTRGFLPVPELLGISLDAVNALDLFLAALLMIVAQPVAEELVFRGVALPAFWSAFGSWIGLIVSAVTYGVFHWLAYTPTYAAEYGLIASYWYGAVAPMLAGLVFGIIRAAGGSTRGAVAAHVAFGVFAIIKLLILVY